MANDNFYGELAGKFYGEQSVEHNELNGNTIFDGKRTVDDYEPERMATIHLDILFTQYPAQTSEQMAIKDIKFLETVSFENLGTIIAMETMDNSRQNNEYFEKIIFDSITMSQLQSPIEHLRYYFVI